MKPQLPLRLKIKPHTFLCLRIEPQIHFRLRAKHQITLRLRIKTQKPLRLRIKPQITFYLRVKPQTPLCMRIKLHMPLCLIMKFHTSFFFSEQYFKYSFVSGITSHSLCLRMEPHVPLLLTINLIFLLFQNETSSRRLSQNKTSPTLSVSDRNDPLFPDLAFSSSLPSLTVTNFDNSAQFFVTNFIYYDLLGWLTDWHLACVYDVTDDYAPSAKSFNSGRAFVLPQLYHIQYQLLRYWYK
jgi:hypothetical protein